MRKSQDEKIIESLLKFDDAISKPEFRAVVIPRDWLLDIVRTYRTEGYHWRQIGPEIRKEIDPYKFVFK